MEKQTNKDDATDDSLESIVRLPDTKHRLYRWLVRSGSAVRRGERVAEAVATADSMAGVPKTIAGNAASSTVSVAATGHKRPMKRSRPTVGAIATGAATPSEEPASVTAPHGTEPTLSEVPTTKEQSTIHIIAPIDGILHIFHDPADYIEISKEKGMDRSLVLGRVSPCPHPTILDSLCAICGQSAKALKPTDEELDSVAIPKNLSPQSHATKDGLASTRSLTGPDDQGGSNESNTMARMTVAGLTVSISHEESQRMAEQDAQRLHSLKKLSLVLDLDHTLVHATNDPRAGQHLHRDDVRSILLPMTEEPSDGSKGRDPYYQEGASKHIQQPLTQHFLKLRPHLKTFLERLLPLYEIGVYTAGTRDYAEQVCMVMARLLVGAEHDVVHLMDLRHSIAQMQATLAAEKAANPTNAAAAKTPPPHTSSVENGVLEHASSTASGSSGDETSDDNGKKRKVMFSEFPPPEAVAQAAGEEESSRRKKRKVTFSEPPRPNKPRIDVDLIQRHIRELQSELAHAELLERMAVDMRQKLFGSRVVSRTDVGDLGRDVKCIKRIFPCGGGMAVVVDDREDVWARAQGVIFAERPGEPPDNLLLVRPYHWDTFSGFADVNNAAGVDLSKLGNIIQAERTQRSERDLQLLWTCNILVQLHDKFFSHATQAQQQPVKVTVPHILAEMRRKVLPGARIVMSGLVPLHHQQRGLETDKPRPAVVRYVESLGAKYHTTLKKSTTHVVASKDGTEKIMMARKIPNCFVVKPSWLMECYWSLSRRSEQAHLLGPPPLKQWNADDAGQTESLKNSLPSSSEDEDDDDLAAELERELMTDPSG